MKLYSDKFDRIFVMLEYMPSGQLPVTTLRHFDTQNSHIKPHEQTIILTDILSRENFGNCMSI